MRARRRRNPRLPPVGRRRLATVLPWVVGGLALVAAIARAASSPEVQGLDLGAFSAIPVLEGGRVKPIDSVARSSLLLIRGQQGFLHQGRRVGPDEWLLDVMFRPEVADTQPIFVIDDPDLLGTLGLQPSSNRHHSARELAPHVAEIQRQGEWARAVEPRRRSRFQAAALSLLDRAFLYYRLKNTMEIPGAGGLVAETALAASTAPASLALARQHQETLAARGYFRALPPPPPGTSGAWRNVGEGLQAMRGGESVPGLEAWSRLSSAYRARDASAFQSAAGDIRASSAPATPGGARITAVEAVFNRAEPFHSGMVIYVLASLALVASLLGRPTFFRAVALALLLAGLAVHSAALACRVAIQGRPPVTNLYSSAVFVGWVAVVLGAAVERIQRRGFGTAVGAGAGFTSLIVAHHLAAAGDTMEMMRAVLDSNFWLATHVVTITVGYGATFFAGALGILHAVRRQVSRQADPPGTAALASMIYGVLCFALLFSFVGTVLGGIWADQSWGRFWGWDPKENGALLIVLWNAVILHARLAGLVRERGLAAMSIFGNVITALSWFGVNMLGVGLHSYGFTDRAFQPLAIFVGSQLVLAALALAPPVLARRASPATSGTTGLRPMGRIPGSG